jgi:DNA-binding beta-propeller fold protein YncE
LILCAALIALAVMPGSALASGRSFEYKISPLHGAYSVALAPDQTLWATDGGEILPNNPGQDGIYKYGAFPSQTRLQTINTYSLFSYYILDLQAAVDDETGELFVAQSNGRSVAIFDESGNYTHSWTAINKANTCFNCTPDIHVAIDNSHTYSRGRVYLSLTSPENDVEAVDVNQRPVDFPATASYINSSKLTGTPSGPFGEVGFVTVDSEGNIYVTDWGNEVVDEFASTGTFLRAFPASGAHQGYPGTGGVGVDPTNGNVLVATNTISEYDSSGNKIGMISEDASGTIQTGSAPAITTEGHVYVPDNERIDVYGPATKLPSVEYGNVTSPTTTSGTLNATVGPNGGGNVTECKFEWGTSTAYGESAPCSPDPASSPPGSNFSSPTAVSTGLSGLTAETTYHFRVVAVGPGGTREGADQTYTPHRVIGLLTEAATELTESSAKLHGSFIGNGEETHYEFEWGPTTSYGNATPMGSATGPESVSASLGELMPFSTYHFRIVAHNGAGTSYGADRSFTTIPGKPTGEDPAVTVVHSDRAILHGQVNPRGAKTVAHFEYVTDATFQASGWAEAESTPSEEIGMSKHFQEVTDSINGLQAGTLYHYRVVGVNEAGSGTAEATFHTFNFTPSVNDPCPNAHVRQQTGTSLLLDCRAYELVSAASTGGYDVESDLVPGETPFADHPLAENPPRVLYGVHDGGVPGTGHPTNRGVDPYVATRGPEGWKTEYVGIPADETPSTVPFGSPLKEADASLGTFAFGGADLCSPCFGDGSSGEPLHLPNGSLVQGMVGSISQPSAEPAGYVARHLSADGTHFVFGSTSQFEPDGNNNGDVSIYDRDLSTGTTKVVSKLPGGATMTGSGIGELDISADGSRIVYGQLVGETAGNKYWHLYMSIDDSKFVDLTPGTTSGALYDGMTGDGSVVYFTTADQLANGDTDQSADIYRAEVAPEGESSLSVVSVGKEGSGNDEGCVPSANTVHEFWNTTGDEETCGAVAVGGDGGVAEGDGAIFFLSPEKLDGAGNGVANAPNLYVAQPGTEPSFVATLESSANAPLPPVEHPFIRNIGSGIQNPSGVAIYDATGDVYVLDIGGQAGTGYVYKFDAAGHPVTSFGSNGKLTVSGVYGQLNLPTEIAVDQSNGDLYVPDLLDGLVNKFDPNGNHISQVEFQSPSGVAVDPANGNLYVSSIFGEIGIFKSDGTPVSSFTTEFEFPTGPNGLAVDSSGKVYVINGGGYAAAKGSVEMYDSAGNNLGQFDAGPADGVAIDQSSGDVYVDRGEEVSEFDSAGNPIGAQTGEGRLSHSMSLAVDEGTLDISNPNASSLASYGPAVLPSDPQTDSPLVIDSVSEGEVRKTADFQVSSNGAYAVFPTTRPLTGYDNASHPEVFRYDSSAGRLDCASCNQTGEQATGQASLASNGLSVTEDGRVFFNSTEGLVDRDLNEKQDAYEWEPIGLEALEGTQACESEGGCVDLISTGTSPFDSSLLGASADGVDAFFFTRDSLVPEDANGNRVKIYDARVGGGYAQVPPPVPCQASDECHGASTQPPPPPNIKTIPGNPIGNEVEAPLHCKKGTKAKHGRCVKEPKHHHRHRHQARHRGKRLHG